MISQSNSSSLIRLIGGEEEAVFKFIKRNSLQLSLSFSILWKYSSLKDHLLVAFFPTNKIKKTNFVFIRACKFLLSSLNEKLEQLEIWIFVEAV